ncbi:hypothetical protein SCHPADRAFT_944179 [Schizopora paradoxa]|uniref:FAD/NAD(P)-binding domain-containing protein n=1 Tax=Schizopora paradoxa TaxID=27342 RepID=A0A0H2RVB8_9AGAM|nr:hypothetical protein SCHPADRAFT_944179 [Schizopora paradoxa]
MVLLSEVLSTIAVSVIATILWRIGGSLLSDYFYRRYTVTKELLNIGKARSESERIPGTAVICGGSIAGLWAARICADHFEYVAIVDPEAWLATDDGITPLYDDKGDKLVDTPHHPRTRLHQYFAGHVFWNLTLLALRRLFPDFDEELLKRDGRIGEAEMNSYTCSGRFFRSPRVWYPNGRAPEMFVCSREAYERLLRFLVVKYSSRIRRIAGTVTGIKPYADDPQKIESAIVSQSSPTGVNTSEVSAALVVDCTGGTQAGFKWVKKLYSKSVHQEEDPGRWKSLVTSYDIHSSWRAYDFFVPPELRASLPVPGGYDKCSWLYGFVPFLGNETKYFVIYRVEGHRIRFSFYGATVDFNLLEQLLKVNDEEMVFNGKLPCMNWIHYEKAPFVPSNFVAIGDAVMKVNPTFGQGCTKACVGAIVLDSLLRSRCVTNGKLTPGFSSKFFDTQFDKIADAWDGTKPLDYMFSTTTPAKGERLEDEKMKGSLALLLLELATKDLEIDALLVHIRQFIAPTTDLFAPWVLWRLLKFGLGRKIERSFQKTS